MRGPTLLLGAVLLAAVAQAQNKEEFVYKPLSNDEKRDGLFSTCSKDFKEVSLLTNATETTSRNPVNMRECAGKCSLAYRTTSYDTFLKCFSCCDSHYGRTPDDARGPFLPLNMETYYDSPPYSNSKCEWYKYPKSFSATTPSSKILVAASVGHRPWGFKLTSSILREPYGAAFGGALPASAFTASSRYDNNDWYAPSAARLAWANNFANPNSGAWVPEAPWRGNAAHAKPWLQVDLGAVGPVAGVATQGRGYGSDWSLYSQWVKSFTLQYSTDGVTFQDVKDKDGETAIFEGNVDSFSIRYNALNEPVRARYIRFLPLTYHSIYAMRVEIFKSASAPNIGGYTHDAQVVWVEDIRNDAARVCISETLRANDGHDGNSRVDFLAVNSLQARTKTRMGSETVPGFDSDPANAQTKQCKSVTFAEAMDEYPVVIVTPTHRGSKADHIPVGHWIERVTPRGFTACFFTALNKHFHADLGFDWFAFRSGEKIVDAFRGTKAFETGYTGTNWIAMNGDGKVLCQDQLFNTSFAGNPPRVIVTPAGTSPITAWLEETRTGGFSVCVSFLNGWLPSLVRTEVTVSWLAVADSPAVKGVPPTTCEGLPTGIQELDIDDDPTTEPVKFYCRDGLALLASYYNTAEDDFPNTLSSYAKGWSKVKSGEWKEGNPDLILPYGKRNAAYGAEFAEMLRDRGWKSLVMCFVSENQDTKICRRLFRHPENNPAAANPGKQGASVDVYNDDVSSYFAWLYARVLGFPYSSDRCFSVTTTDASTCQYGWGTVFVNRGNRHDFGYLGVENGAGLSEHGPNAGWGAWNGVWHGWGEGMSFRPTEKNLAELGNAYGFNPNGNVGFMIWASAETRDIFDEAKVDGEGFNRPVHLGYQRGEQGRVRLHGKARVNVKEGELYEAMVTCNLINYDSAWRNAGSAGCSGSSSNNVYMRLKSRGSIQPANGVKPNLGVAANGVVSQATYVYGLFESTTSGTAEVWAEEWAEDETCFVSYHSCAVSLTKVRSGRGGSAVTIDGETTDFPSVESNQVVARRVGDGPDQLTKDLSASVQARAGEEIYVRLTCGLWTNGGSVSMKAVSTGAPDKDAAEEVMPAAYYIVSAPANSPGVWGSGVSQGVWRAKKAGLYSFQGSYRAERQGSYGSCSILATIQGNAWGHTTSSNAAWNYKWPDNFSSPWRVAPFQARVMASEGELVRAVVTCNMINAGGPLASAGMTWDQAGATMKIFGAATSASYGSPVIAFGEERGASSNVNGYWMGPLAISSGGKLWAAGASELLIRVNTLDASLNGMLPVTVMYYGSAVNDCTLFVENLGYPAA